MAIRFNVNEGGSFHGNDEGAKEQTVTELTANLKKLEEEYKLKHPVPNGNLLAKKLRDDKAEEWAKKEEPKRDLPYLLQTMKGVPADTAPRNVNGRQFNVSSNLVKSVVRTAPNMVAITLNNGKTYNYAGNAKDVERFLTSPDMQDEIANASKDTPTSIRAIYHAK